MWTYFYGENFLKKKWKITQLEIMFDLTRGFTWDIIRHAQRMELGRSYVTRGRGRFDTSKFKEKVFSSYCLLNSKKIEWKICISIKEKKSFHLFPSSNGTCADNDFDIRTFCLSEETRDHVKIFDSKTQLTRLFFLHFKVDFQLFLFVFFFLTKQKRFEFGTEIQNSQFSKFKFQEMV